MIRIYDAYTIFWLQKKCNFVAEKVLRCYIYSLYQRHLIFLTLRKEILFKPVLPFNFVLTQYKIVFKKFKNLTCKK